MSDFGGQPNSSTELTDAMLATLVKEVAHARVRVRALIELLEEKGIFAEGEFDTKAQAVWRRDYDQLVSDLLSQVTDGD